MTCTALPTLIANAKFIHRSSYKIFHAGCSPQLVREMLAMLQLVDCLWIELNLTQNRVFAFLGRKQHVHMEIEWALALANLILHPNDLEMVRRFDALIGAHKILGGLADERRTHHIRHKLCIRPLLLFFAVLGYFYGNTIGALRLSARQQRTLCGPMKASKRRATSR